MPMLGLFLPVLICRVYPHTHDQNQYLDFTPICLCYFRNSTWARSRPVAPYSLTGCIGATLNLYLCKGQMTLVQL